MTDDLTDSVWPAIASWLPPDPPAIIEVWRDIAIAQEAAYWQAVIAPESLMSEVRFREIVDHPSVFWGTHSRAWRLVPAPMSSATRTAYAD